MPPQKMARCLNVRIIAFVIACNTDSRLSHDTAHLFSFLYLGLIWSQIPKIKFSHDKAAIATINGKCC